MSRKAKGAWIAVVLGLGLIGLGFGLQEFRLFERAWFAYKEDRYEKKWGERSLWLPDYYVSIEAKPVAGLEHDLSALTYDPDRNTLFSVTNQQAELVELSLEGDLLRRIKLEGFGDAEAIEYVGPGQYVITDERRQRLNKVIVKDDTHTLVAGQGQQLSLAIDLNGNKGFEGLAYDAVGQRLFVGKERDPIRIYEIKGFPHRTQEGPYAVHILDNPKRDAGLFIRDLSSLDYDPETGHLLVLSDESRLVLEINAKGKPISALSLRAGSHGLKANVPQAEGVATDRQGNLYLVSEPNLFYKFSKP